jgi:[protein-PII] uridylyltransferase
MPSQTEGSPASLRAVRDALVAAATGPSAIVAFPTNYGLAADDFLFRLLQQASDANTSGLALIAVGGYGRGELCPGSDLDVVLLHRGRRDIDRVAASIWYPVWDEGVRLDHSVRTPRELLAMARSDLRVALGLVDGRYVAGDADLAAEVLPRAREQYRSQARSHLEALAASVVERHSISGEVAFLLEPDLKESRGGLRDFHALRSVAAALEALAPKLRIDSVETAHRVLLSARVCLHLRTRRHGDRLLLELQDEVAALLDLDDADVVMASVAAAGREIAWACDDAWRRVRSHLAGPSRRGGGRDRELAPGVVLRDGEVSVRNEIRLDATALLLAASRAAADGHDLAPELLERAAVGLPGPPSPWTFEMRRSFLALLAAGTPAIPVLEALDHRHLLEGLVPEWTAVRSLPQRNAYHRFTVDRHLLETVANAATLVRQVRRPDLLLVGALVHDIGKGYAGDHTEAGVVLAPVIVARMGFPPADVATVTALVEHHLLLPDTATRRDLEDPATIEMVAGKVGDRETLELLAALTEADSRATGPAAWSPWKARLVRLLVERVALHLEAGAVPPSEPGEPGQPIDRSTVRSLLEGSSNGVAVTAIERAGFTQVTLAAPDRPGLLAITSGVLALQGLAVLRAEIGAEEGVGVGRFEVECGYGRLADPTRIENDLRAALSGELALDPRLQAPERDQAARRPRSAHPAQVVVLTDDSASARATVVEVRAPDSFGLLHRIARALTECALDVASAHVSTLGHEVVDVFYVRDALTRTKLDPTRRDEVRDYLRAVLGRAGNR